MKAMFHSMDRERLAVKTIPASQPYARCQQCFVRLPPGSVTILRIIRPRQSRATYCLNCFRRRWPRHAVKLANKFKERPEFYQAYILSLSRPRSRPDSL